MDATTLAIVTSALTVLATESVKGVASHASKDLWDKVKSLLGWKSEPGMADLAFSIVSRLEKDEALMAQIVNLLKTVSPTENTATALVGRMEATKAVVVNRLDVAGDFRM